METVCDALLSVVWLAFWLAPLYALVAGFTEPGLTRSVVFVCASAVASTALLMNSVSDRFPNGLGNDSGELGHNLMDHHFKVGASGVTDDFGLGEQYADARLLRIADGPDEVHNRAIARIEFKKYKPAK